MSIFLNIEGRLPVMFMWYIIYSNSTPLLLNDF